MPDSASPEEFDVVVAGGGPGGSTTAALVAMAGHRVLLLEREHFPRYQIGESLLPSTVHGIGRLLGVGDALREAGFTRKRGGTFRWGSSPEPWTFSFADSPGLGESTGYAYQVERTRFDELLLDHARQVGADVREGCTVRRVLRADGRDDGRVHGLAYRTPDGAESEVHARYVVDASGNTGRLHRAAGGERVYSPFFRNIAVFGYFENGRRLPPPNQGNILCAAFDGGWFWYIPLSDRLTSVGAVVHREHAGQVQGDPEQALAKLVDRCPLVRDHLADARRVTEGTYGAVRVRKDYSYCDTRFWAPGVALVGDAACFIDPVFSSGVHLATYAAMLTARSINTVLGTGMDERRAFDEFEARYRREYTVFHDFLAAFYTMQAPSDTYFQQARELTGGQAGAVASFINLVGGLASGDRALTDAGQVTDLLGTAAQVLDKSVRGYQPSTDGDPWDESPMLGETFAQSDLLAEQGTAGGGFGETAPQFPGGLVATEDGLHWAEPTGPAHS
ncbi:tryptophan 7-halogenase [Streptomyces monomycini]|uniref:tryptophan 7-halogenase n=1 Tax=Streptomyces monomycini TaxID=371720 RepID=UPI0004AA07A8|nr:tryptophan 7-halogenase [Streptomyces monomycini]